MISQLIITTHRVSADTNRYKFSDGKDAEDQEN